MPMPMHGGPGMSMPWGPGPGKTWVGAAASFLGMWIVMMAAMMLPSLAPVLGRRWRALRGLGVRQAGRLTAIAGVGYLLVWAACGLAAFPLGLCLTTAVAERPALARAAPIAAGAVVMIAGAFQFAAWKAHHLACMRDASGHHRIPATTVAGSLRSGLRLGLHCCASCLNLTVVLLVVGVMDLRAMTAVTAAITLERFGPAGARVGRAIGAVIVAAGLFMLARARGIA